MQLRLHLHVPLQFRLHRPSGPQPLHSEHPGNGHMGRRPPAHRQSPPRAPRAPPRAPPRPSRPGWPPRPSRGWRRRAVWGVSGGCASRFLVGFGVRAGVATMPPRLRPRTQPNRRPHVSGTGAPWRRAAERALPAHPLARREGHSRCAQHLPALGHLQLPLLKRRQVLRRLAARSALSRGRGRVQCTRAAPDACGAVPVAPWRPAAVQG